MNLPFVLDVAIGLIFTYLILSLLASELQELLATFLQWRAKHLKDSIEILLAGGVGTKEEQRVKDLVGRLYDDPLLKNVNQEAKGAVSRGFRKLSKVLFAGNRKGAFGAHHATGPSYISPETFATSLLERLGVSKLADNLSKVRVEKFARRIVGTYRLNQDQIEIPADEELKDDWEKGNIRVIAEKTFKQNLNQDQNFSLLVEDYDQIVRLFKANQLTLSTTIERLGEELDTYIAACENPQFQDTDLSLFVRRLRSFKKSTFGENNERAVTSGGLQPSLSEIAELVDQSSTIHKEAVGAYEKIAVDAEPISARVKATIAADVATYDAERNSKLAEFNKPAQAALTFEDLERSQQQAILSNALGQLTPDERQLYEDHQAYQQIKEGLDKLPDSVKESIAVLARRAQTRVRKTENDLNQLREEVAIWFDRSMERGSGVYKRNAKGVALLIGLSIAAATNSDTFHIFNRLSSDDSLRRMITARASQIDLSATNNPRLDVQLEQLKNQTDAVLRDIAFPISWSPTNLNKQLGCQTLEMAEQANPQDEATELKQRWDNLYKSCLSTDQAATVPIPFQVMQIVAVKPLGFLRMICGWAVSGLAIAMGAPFWFDLLGKLVNVRNSGNKPKSTPDQSPPT